MIKGESVMHQVKDTYILVNLRKLKQKHFINLIYLDEYKIDKYSYATEKVISHQFLYFNGVVSEIKLRWLSRSLRRFKKN